MWGKRSAAPRTWSQLNSSWGKRSVRPEDAPVQGDNSPAAGDPSFVNEDHESGGPGQDSAVNEKRASSSWAKMNQGWGKRAMEYGADTGGHHPVDLQALAGQSQNMQIDQ